MLWNPPETPPPDSDGRARPLIAGMRDYFKAMHFDEWAVSTDRRGAYLEMCKHNQAFHGWLSTNLAPDLGSALGLALDPATAPGGIARDAHDKKPVFRVNMFRPARRIGPDGQEITDVVVELIQRRQGFFDARRQEAVDAGRQPRWSREVPGDCPPDFYFRGGCTLVIDPRAGAIRYCVRKSVTQGPGPADEVRLAAEREFRQAAARGGTGAYLAPDARHDPFAALHAGH